MMMFLMYIKAFLVGGLLCAIGEVLVLRTKITPARILVCYILAGVVLSAVGLYGPLADFAGAGANRSPHRLWACPLPGRFVQRTGKRSDWRFHRRPIRNGRRYCGGDFLWYAGRSHL